MTDTAKNPPLSATADKFIIRFNADGLRKDLKVRAAQNERTLNAEILYLIKRGLEAEQGKGPQHEKESVSTLIQRSDQHSQQGVQ